MLRRIASVGCLAALAGVACSGKIEGPQPVVVIPDDEPVEAEMEVTPVTPPPVPDEPTRAPVVARDPEPVGLLQAQVEDILGRTCGECHGAAGTAQGNLDSIEDLDALADRGLLNPGEADASDVITRMISGNMPPPGFDGPTSDEIQQIVQFVNGWDGPDPLPEVICNNAVVPFDTLFSLMQADLLSQDGDDRPFMRYLTLANRHNAGVCGDEIQVERWALSKLVNSLSTETRIERPLALDEDELLFRIDIRDYGWDREVDVEGDSFADGWEAIVGSTDYAVPFEGDEADFVNLATETDIPLLYADALAAVTAVGPLYYALLEIPDNVDALLDDLRIDVEENRDRGEAIRAGTTKSGLSTAERLIERHEVGAGAGRSYWQSFDFGEGSNDTIFVSPLDFQEAESESIFTLINGLQAYAIFDENGQLQDESRVLFDTVQDNFRVRNAVSCMTCHSRGPLQVRDEVRAYAEIASVLSFDADEREAIFELYPGPEELDAVVEADREVYQRALTQAGVPTDRADPVSDTFLRFNRDVTLEDVAGDLGLSAEELGANLGLLDSRLRLLNTITLDRDDFSVLFQESLCLMQRVSRNRPEDGFCDDLLND